MSLLGLTNILVLVSAVLGQANFIRGKSENGGFPSNNASSVLATPTCGGGSAYPTLLGAQYNWTAYQLEWMPGNAPGYGFFHSIVYQPDFPQQMDLTGKPNASGRFALLRFTSIFAGTAYILCVFDTQATLTCIASDGGFFGRFFVAGNLSQGCVPGSLLESAGYLSPATGWVVMVRAGVVALVSHTEVQVVAQSTERLHGQAPAAVPTEIESTTVGCNVGFPALAGANYSLTSYRFTRSANASLGAANFSVDNSWTLSFFDNLTQYNALNWGHQYVQLTINNGERWALCVFDNATRSASSNSSFNLLCSVHPEGRFIMELSVSPLAVNAQTCVPSRLSLKVASGSLLVSDAAANSSTRQVLVWTGVLQLTAYNGSATLAAQSGPAHLEGTFLGADTPQTFEATSAAPGSWYPSLVNQTYTWQSSQLTCLSNQSGNMSVVVQPYVRAKFFNQVGTDGKPSPIGSFVQLLMSDNTSYSYYAICAFQDTWALRCVSSADGLLVHDFQVQSDSVNMATHVPSRLTELRHGSLALPGDLVVRKGLLAIGEPSLKA